MATKKVVAEEEARRLAARMHGTMVTPETFAAWKEQFEAERAAVCRGGMRGAEEVHISAYLFTGIWVCG